MPARSSAACGAQTGLLAMPSQSTRAKVLLLQTRKRSGSSMITFSGQILPTWPYQEWSISASSSGWYAPRRRVPVRHAASLSRSRRSSSTKSSRGSWWPKSVNTRLKGYDLTSKSIISLDSRRPNRTAVERATLSCSGLISVDRLDITMGHIRENTRLTCLECIRKRGNAVLNA